MSGVCLVTQHASRLLLPSQTYQTLDTWAEFKDKKLNQSQFRHPCSHAKTCDITHIACMLYSMIQQTRTAAQEGTARRCCISATQCVCTRWLGSLPILSAHCPPHAWQCLKHEILHFFSFSVRWPNCHFGTRWIWLLTNPISNRCNDPQQLAQFEGQTMEKKSDTFFGHYTVPLISYSPHWRQWVKQDATTLPPSWPHMNSCIRCCLIFWPALIKLSFCVILLVLFCFLEGLYFSLAIGLLYFCAVSVSSS